MDDNSIGGVELDDDDANFFASISSETSLNNLDVLSSATLGFDLEALSSQQLDWMNPFQDMFSNGDNMIHNLRTTSNLSSGSLNPEEVMSSQSSSNPADAKCKTKMKRKHDESCSVTDRGFRVSFGDDSTLVSNESEYKIDTEAIAQVKEMIYRAAALRPVNVGQLEEASEKPKRKNVKISSDPQTVAARQRRERISERLRVLQRLVPGGTKMDTASMLDEAANYLKFLKSQVTALQTLGNPHAFTFTMHNNNNHNHHPFKYR